VPVEVILPKVDMDMTEGTLATWHVAEGDCVTQGAALFDIETDKAAMEVESPATGRLHHITAAPGDRVAVGTVIAVIYLQGEAVGTATAIPTLAVKPAAAIATPPPNPEFTPIALRATPAARTAARSAGIALDQVPGTGPQGRIQRDDVLTLHTPAPPHPPSGWTAQSGPLHISRRKGGPATLVMLHGFTADSQSWAPLEKSLGAALGLIRIDLPGHGTSPRRPVRNFADLARMVVEAFDDATRDTGPVHLLGHSLGGAVATAIADIRGPRIASLTLIAPAGLGPEIDAAALNGIVRARSAESLGPWLRRLTATPQGISDDFARAAMKLRTDPALRACQADMACALFPDGVQAFDLRAALSRLDLPVQILWGRQDHILPFRQAHSADGDFGVHLLSGAGHVPQLECPDRVARLIARLIAAVQVALQPETTEKG